MQLCSSIVLLAPLFAPFVVGAGNAHQIDSVSGLGPVEKAYVDLKTHKVFVEGDVPADGAIEQRSYQTGNPQDTIVKLLKKNNGYGFCKAFCPGYSPKPVTKTNMKTAIKTIYKTSTQTPRPVTVTLTATAGAPSAVAVTETTTQSTTIDLILTAEPNTITSTSLVFATETETVTSTVTSTLAIPTETAIKRRGQSPPSWLRGYASHLFCPACKRAWPKPSPKTTTVCKTTTRSTTITRTTSLPVSTKTATATVTPVANTITTTATAVLTFTNTETYTPLETQTVEETSTTTVTQTATSTVSICAQQTNSIGGISARAGSHLEVARTPDVVGCCLACYNSPLGCQKWAFLGSGFCFFAVSGTSAGGGVCPNGKGNAELALGGPEDLAGGPGPCQA